jgi:plasmid stabilization system protein ParE
MKEIEFLPTFTKTYERDKEMILTYLIKTLANRWAAIVQDTAFDNAEEAIIAFPFVCPIYKRMFELDIRKKLARNYQIYYFLDDKKLVFTRILHPRQDFGLNY